MVGADTGVSSVVDEIIEAVRLEGDSALIRYTNNLDNRNVLDPGLLEVEFKGSVDSLQKELRQALEVSAQRIRVFHERQKDDSWEADLFRRKEEGGNVPPPCQNLRK